MSEIEVSGASAEAVFGALRSWWSRLVTLCECRPIDLREEATWLECANCRKRVAIKGG